MGRWWLLFQSGCSLTLRPIIYILCSIHTLQNSTFTREKKRPLTSHMAQIVAVAPDQTPHKILVELVVWHHELLASTDYTETLQVHCDPLGTFLLLLKFQITKITRNFIPPKPSVYKLQNHLGAHSYSSRVSNDTKNTTASSWFARDLNMTNLTKQTNYVP